jgi:bifunctional UDP-N-acetylglucosamine pyrophosphorylase/glucosamine-1-phosphate N-acetyltransferase
MDKNKIGVVILAAGEGKRMQSTLPKVMTPLFGKPLVEHVVEKVETISYPKEIVIVVSPKHSLVQEHLGSRAQYIVQTEQLGTGHATATATPLLEKNTDHVVVLYGDMPSLSTASIDHMIKTHLEKENTITLMTTTVPSFEGEYVPLKSFGRIVRGEDGHILRSVEYKDASEEEREIRELNPCFYCFKSEWLWENLPFLKNENVQSEYYLTDLIKMALEKGEKLSSVDIFPKEALGINTKEDLESVNKFLEV